MIKFRVPAGSDLDATPTRRRKHSRTVPPDVGRAQAERVAAIEQALKELATLVPGFNFRNFRGGHNA